MGQETHTGGAAEVNTYKRSLLSAYLFSSAPVVLRLWFQASPTVKRLAKTRSAAHLLTGYLLAGCIPAPERTVYDVVRAYAYLVALRMAGYAKSVPRLLDWSDRI